MVLLTGLFSDISQRFLFSDQADQIINWGQLFRHEVNMTKSLNVMPSASCTGNTHFLLSLEKFGCDDDSFYAAIKQS